MYVFIYSYYVVSLIYTLECDSGFEYIKIRKQSQFNANQEKFKILSNNVVLYQNPDMVDFQLRELETCIPSSTLNQYTLELSDSYYNLFQSLLVITLVGQAVVG